MTDTLQSEFIFLRQSELPEEHELAFMESTHRIDCEVATKNAVRGPALPAMATGGSAEQKHLD